MAQLLSIPSRKPASDGTDKRTVEIFTGPASANRAGFIRTLYALDHFHDRGIPYRFRGVPGVSYAVERLEALEVEPRAGAADATGIMAKLAAGLPVQVTWTPMRGYLEEPPDFEPVSP